MVGGRSAIAATASSSVAIGPSLRPVAPQKTALGYRAASHAALDAEPTPARRESPMAAAAGTDSADSSAAISFTRIQ